MLAQYHILGKKDKNHEFGSSISTNQSNTTDIYQIAKNSITKSKEVSLDIVALSSTRCLLGYLLPPRHGHTCGAG
jgi:hypothetical protein